jgi:hypothetical protein
MWYLLPDIAMSDVVISLFFVVLLALYLFRRPRSEKPKIEPIPPLPIVTDAHFEEKLARTLRAQLSLKYSPEHARAHTFREISRYAKWDPLLDILKEIEDVLYQSGSLTQEKRQILLDLLK